VVRGGGGRGGGPHVLLMEVVVADHGSWLPMRFIVVVASGHMATRLGACGELICTILWSYIQLRVGEVGLLVKTEL
jgi:hypothetical protein